MNAKATDFRSISTSSSQINTARVLMDPRGKNRELRLADGCRTTEMGAPPEETERLRESRVRVSVGVEGFPHRMRTEATNGDPEYVAAIEKSSEIRDTEYPFIMTVN